MKTIIGVKKISLAFLFLLLLFTVKAPMLANSSSKIALVAYDSSGNLLSEVEVYMDDELIGKTSSQGFLKFEAKPGEHTIKVKKAGYETVTETIQLESGELQQLRVELRKERNEKPVARFSYSPEKVKKGEKVTFNAAKSYDPDGYIKKWKWSFGDGSKSSKPNPEHDFKSEGEYRVRLTVIDNKGAKDSTSIKIDFSNKDPRPSLKISPSKPRVGEKMKFNAESSSDPDGEIKKYSWDLDNDGEIDHSGKEPVVRFSFSSPGQREVKLYVTDNEGSRVWMKKTLKVVKKKGKVEIEEKHALVIGITEHKDPSLNNLYFPAEDAKDFAKALTDEDVGGFKKENVTTLINEEATTQGIESALKKLVTEVDERDLVVIYFSGHGARGPDPNGDEKRRNENDTQDEYFVTYDTDPTSRKTIYRTAFSDDQFSYLVFTLPSDKVAVFLDSGYSGGIELKLNGRALFAASQENQCSHEPPKELRDKLGHGVFTYYLLEGLRGEADQNEDGLIKLEELKSYVKPNVKKFVRKNFVNARQTPVFKGKPSVGNLVLRGILN